MEKQNFTYRLINIVNKIITFFVTSSYLGFIPFAPGTFGSLLAIPLFLLFSSPLAYYILLVALLVLGTLASDYANKFIFDVHDSPMIVIDETAGCFLSMIIIDKEDSFAYIILCFILFRVFDILKPPPIRYLERLKGGFGIMLDDIMAAIYTILVLFFAKYFF